MNVAGEYVMAVRVGHAWVTLCWVVLHCGGCSNSAYHRARELLPADRAERVELRVHEATQVARELLNQTRRISTGPTPESQRAAHARIEPLAWEFERRVLSIGDAIERAKPPPPLGVETLDAFRAASVASNALSDALLVGADAEAARLSASRSLRAALDAADQFRLAR